MHFKLAEPPSGLPYNALQQLAYFGVVFVLAPLQIATGAAMSPAVIGRIPMYARLFGTRQAARTIHFAGLCAFGLFVIVHTAMVVAHGLANELGRVTLASDHANPAAALIVGGIGLAAIIAVNVVATVVGRSNPRQAQVVLGRMVDRLQAAVSYRLESHQRYHKRDITSYFWTNGYPPAGPLYQTLAAHDFQDWRLRVQGLVDKELELSLGDLHRMRRDTQITKHNCIQGWTGVAQWAGVPLSEFIERCGVRPEARYIAFHAFDDKGITQKDGEGFYYETLDLRLARGPQALLAYEFNGRPLPIEHGAPLRLRVENQLGFKMVKWIRAISFELDYRHLGLGYGGWREDHAYYSRVVGI
jgi:DMSO/TMAO reductase YedYZ molybdopterin-dependent catalytic subunit